MSKTVNRLILGSFSTVFLGVISCFIYDAIKDKPFLSTIKYLLLFISHIIIAVLNFPIKLWWLLLSLAIVFIILTLSSSKKSTLPEFLDYKKDTFRNWIWRWDWFYNNRTQNWNIKNLEPCCQYCDVPLLNRGNRLHQLAICPKCNSQYRDFEDKEATELLILDKVKKKNYTENI